MAAAPKTTRDTYHHGALKEAALEQGIRLLKEVGVEKFEPSGRWPAGSG